MSDYAKRKFELSGAVENWRGKITDEEVLRLNLAVADYVTARQSSLDDLRRMLEDTSASNVHQTPWRDRVSRAREEAASKLANALSSIDEPTTPALAFVTVAGREEDAFWSSLHGLNAADVRDRIVANREKVAKMTTDLEEKWRTIEAADESIATKEWAIETELEYSLQQACEKAASKRRTVHEQLVAITVLYDEWPKKLKSFEGQMAAQLVKKAMNALADATIKNLNFVLGELKDHSKLWLQTNQAAVQRMGEYRSLVQSEAGGVMVLFGRTYTDTQEFIKTNGFDAAKALYQQAHDELDRWRSGLPTSGLQDDAKLFAEDALKGLSAVLSQTESTFNDFVYKHRGKFFGPLGPDVREALTEKEAWKKATDQLKAIDVETKLRGWRDDAKQFFTVNIDDPINKSIDALEEWGLQQLVPNAERDQIRKEFHDFAGTIKKQVEAEVEELVKRMEESQRIVSGAELDKLVAARDELDRALPA